jgi:hypothetical protein
MAEQDRPIWELDFSLQDLNVSALGQKLTPHRFIALVRFVPELDIDGSNVLGTAGLLHNLG